jgi:hypothetical protein
MGEYTKEPWAYTGEENGDFVVWGAGEHEFVGNVGAAFQQVGVVIDLDYANARRIVACINALQGVPTEQLEEAARAGIKDVSMGNLFSSRLALQKQRDQLREALKEGRRAIGDHFAPDHCYATGPMTGDPVRDLVQCPACSFIAMYDAALAAAGGE